MRGRGGYLLVDVAAATLVVLLVVLPLLTELGSAAAGRQRRATRLQMQAELERLRGRIVFESLGVMRITGSDAVCRRGGPVTQGSENRPDGFTFFVRWQAGPRCDWIILKAMLGDLVERVVVPIPTS